MSHMPSHIQSMPELASTWTALYQQAQGTNIDAETQPIVVKDESQRGALEALAAVGGATVTDAPEGGMNVQLTFEDEEEGEEVVGATAAAKPHTFANRDTD